MILLKLRKLGQKLLFLLYSPTQALRCSCGIVAQNLLFPIMELATRERGQVSPKTIGVSAYYIRRYLSPFPFQTSPSPSPSNPPPPLPSPPYLPSLLTRPSQYGLVTVPHSLFFPPHQQHGVMAQRKLQQEVDRCFKRVSEGIAAFDGIFDKIQQTSNPSQKEKLEDSLKREIKKLQRQRDLIKAWAAGPDIKDKKPLIEHRKAIETVGTFPSTPLEEAAIVDSLWPCLSLPGSLSELLRSCYGQERWHTHMALA